MVPLNFGNSHMGLRDFMGLIAFMQLVASCKGGRQSSGYAKGPGTL